MRLHRFLITDLLAGGEQFLEDRELSHQLSKVLRYKPGQEILLTDGRGREVRATLLGFTKNGVQLSLQHKIKQEEPPAKKISLYVALLKKENFELVVEKATELGVSRIVPLISERTVKLRLNEERLKKISKEAVEQSGQLYLPEIEKPLSFGEALKEAQENDLNLFFDETGQKLKEISAEVRSLGIFIGPEGGWEEGEFEEIKKMNWPIISLGKQTLRAETAAIVTSFWASFF